MNVVFQPTDTSFVNLDMDINEFGIGFQYTMKGECFPFYSLSIFFLFITIYFEWSIDLSRCSYDEGDDSDALE